MTKAAQFTTQTQGSGYTVDLEGDWTAVGLGNAGERLQASLAGAGPVVMDMQAMGRCDTAGALAIARATDGRLQLDSLVASDSAKRLLKLVTDAKWTEPAPPPRSQPLHDLLESIGRGTVLVATEAWGTLTFIGHLAAAIARVVRNPSRMRWTAGFSQARQAGLDAIPIVAVTTFFIGAVVAFLGANELEQFGAQVFVVELVGIAILREFNIVITAVLLAGRSASSFAAEIGAMKMNQEIDAMRVMGVDPFEALVLPRFLALLVTIPVLTFVASIAGLAGGMLVSWVVLDVSPQFFLQQILATVPVSNLWVGLSKGPIMALVIAGIGCRQGLEVGGDVDSLGRRVTSAVVQAIFSIIMIDAVFAMLYVELKV